MITMAHQAIPDEKVKQLFEDAFPFEERREWTAILELLSAGKVKLLYLTRGTDFAGFVCYWPLPEFTFVEYLAIHPSSRGGGAGSYIMQQLETLFGKIVLEVEPPVTEQAIRRIKFYERLGYQIFPDAYYQPAYHKGYPPLELRLMQKGHTTGEAFLLIKNQLYKYVYNLP